MDLSKTKHRNQNNIMTKILAWTTFGSVAIIASIICIKYFSTQNPSGITSMTNTFVQIGLSVLAYIVMPAINIMLIYTSTRVLQKENKFNIGPIYTVITTIFINLLVIVTLSASDLVLGTKTSIAELVSNNFVTANIITALAFLGLNIHFETDNNKPFWISLINIVTGGIVSISIMMNIVSTPKAERLDSISSIASIISSAAAFTIVLMLIILLGSFADEKH